MENSLTEERKQELVDLVCRQTKYNEKEAKEQLILVDYDYMRVLRNYMGISKKEAQPIGSINQTIFKEFRTLLDDAATAYYASQEKKQEIQQEDNTSIDKPDEELQN